MVGDPEQIWLVATRLGDEAERVRWLARRVVGAGDVAWRSPTASLFHSRVAERAHGLRRCAVDLETAARLVEVHAHAVSVARSELARVVARGAGLRTGLGAGLGAGLGTGPGARAAGRG
jgi:hypothetical protein